MMVIKPLTSQQKQLIFGSLRYSFMTHQQLISLLSERGFEDAKEFVREGISCRLASYETSQEAQNFKINVKPRNSYFLPDIVLADPEHEEIQAKNPLEKALKMHVRKELKQNAIDNLTEEQKFVLHKNQTIKNANPYLKQNQADYLKKVDTKLNKEFEAVQSAMKTKAEGDHRSMFAQFARPGSGNSPGKDKTSPYDPKQNQSHTFGFFNHLQQPVLTGQIQMANNTFAHGFAPQQNFTMPTRYRTN